MNPPVSQPYVTSMEEVFWGGTLLVLTMAMHGFGMISVLRVQERLKEWAAARPGFLKGMFMLVLASWMIMLVHLLEVFIWAGFFYWHGAVNAPDANPSLCYYFSLNEYTTLGSNYNLIPRWRLLEGMISVSGLMTFAWSTGVLMTLAQDFQEEQLGKFRKKLRAGHKPAKDAKDAAEAP